MSWVRPQELCRWCSIPADQLCSHPERRVPLRLVRDSRDMDELMARDFTDVIEENNALGRVTRAIVPCGPTCWYAPWTARVNERRISLKNLSVFHMDECLDWQGHPLPRNHPCTFAASWSGTSMAGSPAN